MIKSVNLTQFHITDVNEIHRKYTKYKLLVELFQEKRRYIDRKYEI